MTQFRTTVSAIVADTGVAPIAAHGIEDVGQEKRIAKIVESGNGEEYIVDGTNGKETGQIKRAARGSSLRQTSSMAARAAIGMAQTRPGISPAREVARRD